MLFGGKKSAFDSTHNIYNLSKGKGVSLDFSDVRVFSTKRLPSC